MSKYVENFIFEFEKLENNANLFKESEFKSIHQRLETFIHKLKKVKGISLEDFIHENDWSKAILKINFFDDYKENFEYKDENLFNDIFNQIRNFLTSNDEVLFETISSNKNSEVLFIFSLDNEN